MSSSHAQALTVSPSSTPTYIQARRALPQDGFVRQDVLLQFVPFSKSTLWRRVRAGLFPAPLKLSVGITAWRVEDVRHWIAERS